MIRLALPVSRALGIPLLAQVCDPPHWWLRHHRVDGISTGRILREFDRVLRNSAACASCSWEMAEQYSQTYGTRAIPVMPSLDARLALPPAPQIHGHQDLVLGLAGQVYAVNEWNALIAALDRIDWRIYGRNVKLRLLGRYTELRATKKMHVEFLGWRSQEETIRLLSEIDILYCPYWFDPAFETEARLCFPSKLTTYLAAGRPVLFHGPRYSAPGHFLEKNDAGFCCYSLETLEIVSALERLASDADLYKRLAHNGKVAFEKHLTLSSMRKNFADFLQIDEDSLSPVEASSEAREAAILMNERGSIMGA